MTPKKPSKTTPAPARPAAPPTPTLVPRVGWLVAGAAISAAIVIAASFFPGARLWGVNHLAFFPPAVRWAAIALIVIAFVPLLAGPAYRGLLHLVGRLSSAKRSTRIGVIAAIAVVSIPAFAAFRSSTLLLGDGQLIVRSFEAAEEGHEQVIMRNPKAIVTEEMIAPGTTLAYYAATKVATGPFKKTPLQGLQGLNYLLGAVFVFLLLRVATSGDVGGEPGTWMIVLGATSCSIELFFGYIENYTTPFLLLLFYALAAFRALHRQGPLWLPLIPLVLAVYAHIHSVLFLPSYVYLVLWRRAPQRRATLLQIWTPVFASLTVAGVIAGSFVPQMKRFYVPFGFDNQRYALLAPDHLVDIVNEVFMLLPIVPVVAVMFWIARRAERTAGIDFAGDARARKDPTSWFSHPAEWQFASTILIPCFLYLVLFHPEIGMARDWDLFTMSAIAIVPLVLLILHRYRSATGADTNVLARCAIPGFVVMLVSGAAWVGVNASADRTVTRLESILTYDRTHASYAWENLAMLHHANGELGRAIDAMRVASDVSRNPRQIVRLAIYLEESGQTEEAMKLLEDILARRPAFTKARFRLVLFLEKQGNWERLLEVARGGVEHNPDEAIYRFFYGESLRRAGRNEEALEMFRSCRGMDLPATARQYVEAKLREAEEGGK